MMTHESWFRTYLLACLYLFTESGIALAKGGEVGVRKIFLDEMRVAPIYVHAHGTVLNFPAKPEVHVGRKDAFNIIFVKNDIVISANHPGATTNLFIYLEGRRYTLKLTYSASGGDQIVAIRDPLEEKLEVKVK